MFTKPGSISGVSFLNVISVRGTSSRAAAAVACAALANQRAGARSSRVLHLRRSTSLRRRRGRRPPAAAALRPHAALARALRSP